MRTTCEKGVIHADVVNESDDVEYIRADKVKELQLAAAKAALEAAANGMPWICHQDQIKAINPQAILDSLGK
ncbi:hypothetical protein [Solimicrobium silvestre]|uniref:Uncharacterized protein n=1 Tax=Solimicrobium silvestre TaxID=2099400 RepID=A0A2S9GY28_9BURK|nr:hypothetical protein [Solimicrobium silvestre]PRC92619.1 hypothetical protein S2091_2674 [Solimicrobium silvestre]